MAHRVPQRETQPANQHQAEKDGQQRARAECQLGIAPGPLRLLFLVVEISPHEPPMNRQSCMTCHAATASSL